MATSTEELREPPDKAAPVQVSYSDKIKMNLRKCERLKRKVLEISLENESDGNVNIEEKDVAKLVSRLGIDLKSHMEGFQICPGNSKKILLWLKDSCDLSRYCKDESFKINDTVRTGTIRQMDKSEVTVCIKGLNFNTPDSLVIEYLNKHGKVISDKVIYEVALDGPLKGLKNGTRKYKVDFCRGINLGTYHILDGARIEVRYPGQRRTCGRCHKTSSSGCPGNGIGKVCQEKGGSKVRLNDFMIEHWNAIGFVPADFATNNDLEDEKDIEIKETNDFTPVKSTSTDIETQRFTGVLVKNLPIALPDSDLIADIFEAGASPSDEIKVNESEDEWT